MTGYKRALLARHLAIVKELIPYASPPGAHAMGMATAECIRRELEPVPFLYSHLHTFGSFVDAAEYLDGWLADVDSIKPPKRKPGRPRKVITDGTDPTAV